jgi:small-conductance mechanosensitive channel
MNDLQFTLLCIVLFCLAAILLVLAIENRKYRRDTAEQITRIQTRVVTQEHVIQRQNERYEKHAEAIRDHAKRINAWENDNPKINPLRSNLVYNDFINRLAAVEMKLTEPEPETETEKETEQ